MQTVDKIEVRVLALNVVADRRLLCEFSSLKMT